MNINYLLVITNGSVLPRSPSRIVMRTTVFSVGSKRMPIFQMKNKIMRLLLFLSKSMLSLSINMQKPGYWSHGTSMATEKGRPFPDYYSCALTINLLFASSCCSLTCTGSYAKASLGPWWKITQFCFPSAFVYLLSWWNGTRRW